MRCSQCREMVDPEGHKYECPNPPDPAREALREAMLRKLAREARAARRAPLPRIEER